MCRNSLIMTKSRNSNSLIYLIRNQEDKLNITHHLVSERNHSSLQEPKMFHKLTHLRQLVQKTRKKKTVLSSKTKTNKNLEIRLNQVSLKTHLKGHQDKKTCQQFQSSKTALATSKPTKFRNHQQTAKQIQTEAIKRYQAGINYKNRKRLMDHMLQTKMAKTSMTITCL